MERKIMVKRPNVIKVVNISKKPEKISMEAFASALGAERVESINNKTSPISLMALRQELSEKLHSSGGRPSLEDSTKRQKIPMSDADWKELEIVAKELKKSGVNASAGQVASMIISQSLRSLRNLKNRKLAEI